MGREGTSMGSGEGSRGGRMWMRHIVGEDRLACGAWFSWRGGCFGLGDLGEEVLSRSVWVGG